jgi:ribosomal protein S18 acetylase RimI-like enzyme
VNAPNDIHIRMAAPDDIATLADFNQTMAAETEGRQLDAQVLARGVAAVFDDPARGFYLIAESRTSDLDSCEDRPAEDGSPKPQVVGQLMVTYEHSDWRDGTFFWIQSVYVAPQARRRGVYRALHDEVIARAKARGDVCGVRLYVERNNAAAQQTYEAMGMQRTIYEMFEVSL